MPVVLTRARRSVLTIDVIRKVMRDYAGRIKDTGEFNVMLDGVQFSDDEINNAMSLTVDRYNGLTPIIGNFTATDINRYTLCIGTICLLLNSESWRQVRNMSRVADGDVPEIGVDDKAAIYSQLADMACKDFLQQAREQKIQRNMEGAYGAFGSGYVGTSRQQRG
jgi:hypothetical protein